MSESPASFGSVALRGALIVGVAQIAKIGIQFLSVISLARLLTPQDFGLVASVAPLIQFVATFQEVGLQQAVVQRKELPPAQLDAIFWVMTALGVVCFSVVVALSPVVVWFYQDPRLMLIAIVAGAPIVLNNINGIQLSLLNRTLRFGTLTVIDVAGALCGFLAALFGAWKGWGYWAILSAPIVTACVSFIGASLVTAWRPGRPRFRLEKDIFHFGANLTGFNLVTFFGRQLDTLLIGRYAGSTELGYYDRGQKLLFFPLVNLNVPLARVMLPILSRIQQDKPRLRAVYLRTIRLLTLVAVPGIAALTVVPEDMIRVFFGERWLPVAPIFFWLGLAALVLPLGFTTQWLYIVQGKTKVLFRLGVYTASTVVIGYLIGIHWGAVGIAASYAAGTYLLRMPVDYWLVGRVGPVRSRDLMLVQFPLLAAAGMTWAVANLVLKAELGLHTLPLLIATGIISYGISASTLALLPTGRATLADGWGLVIRVLKGLRRRAGSSKGTAQSDAAGKQAE